MPNVPKAVRFVTLLRIVLAVLMDSIWSPTIAACDACRPVLSVSQPPPVSSASKSITLIQLIAQDAGKILKIVLPAMMKLVLLSVQPAELAILPAVAPVQPVLYLVWHALPPQFVRYVKLVTICRGLLPVLYVLRIVRYVLRPILVPPARLAFSSIQQIINVITVLSWGA